MFGILRWFLAFSLFGILLVLALVLGFFGLILFLVLKLTGALRIAPGMPQPFGSSGQQAHGPDRARNVSQPNAPQPLSRMSDTLPEAPAGETIHHVRAWDEKTNTPIDQYYYKDATGRWVFVKPPKRA
jgi:hypothetical protein